MMPSKAIEFCEELLHFLAFSFNETLGPPPEEACLACPHDEPVTHCILSIRLISVVIRLLYYLDVLLACYDQWSHSQRLACTYVLMQTKCLNYHYFELTMLTHASAVNFSQRDLRTRPSLITPIMLCSARSRTVISSKGLALRINISAVNPSLI